MKNNNVEVKGFTHNTLCEHGVQQQQLLLLSVPDHYQTEGNSEDQASVRLAGGENQKVLHLLVGYLQH